MGKALSWRLDNTCFSVFMLYLKNGWLSERVYLRVSETCLALLPLLLPCGYSQDRAGWESPPWWTRSSSPRYGSPRCRVWGCPCPRRCSCTLWLMVSEPPSPHPHPTLAFALLCFVFLHNNPLHLTRYSIFMLLNYCFHSLPLLEWKKPQDGKKFCLFCSLLYFQQAHQCLMHS